APTSSITILDGSRSLPSAPVISFGRHLPSRDRNAAGDSLAWRCKYVTPPSADRAPMTMLRRSADTRFGLPLREPPLPGTFGRVALPGTLPSTVTWPQCSCCIPAEPGWHRPEPSRCRGQRLPGRFRHARGGRPHWRDMRRDSIPVARCQYLRFACSWRQFPISPGCAHECWVSRNAWILRCVARNTCAGSVLDVTGNLCW